MYKLKHKNFNSLLDHGFILSGERYIGTFPVYKNLINAKIVIEDGNKDVNIEVFTNTGNSYHWWYQDTPQINNVKSVINFNIDKIMKKIGAKKIDYKTTTNGTAISARHANCRQHRLLRT